jgi:peptide/nickel transport system substrate-binding protein
MNHQGSKNGNSAPIGRRRLLKTGGAALALTAAGAAAGVPRRAAAQGKPGGTLTFASTALPPSLEPHMQGLDIWQRRKPLLYENLVWIDYALEPKPELAERWEQKSATEYVFHLRRGVRPGTSSTASG